MRVCPVELHLCDRPACNSGWCEMAGERAMTPCLECGALVLFRGTIVCLDCQPAETPTEA